jgi:hypothetical protein
MRQKDLLPFIFIVLFLSGCMSPKNSSIYQKNDLGEKIAFTHHFQKQLIKTNAFTFTSFQKFSAANQPMTIYIEGDGRTWITKSKLSNNPTPQNPLALKLAVLDKSANVAYLARPCQYTPLDSELSCTPEIWSNLRFSERVIQSMNEAITQLKNTAHSNKIHLVGFSGGAAVAILIAARRNDVVSLKTVAGDLDPVALSQYHHTSPLTGSLNPIAIAHKLIYLPQQHFSGAKDKIVPAFIGKNFLNKMRMLGSHCVTHTVISNATHHAGWEAVWPYLHSGGI